MITSYIMSKPSPKAIKVTSLLQLIGRFACGEDTPRGSEYEYGRFSKVKESVASLIHTFGDTCSGLRPPGSSQSAHVWWKGWTKLSEYSPSGVDKRSLDLEWLHVLTSCSLGLAPLINPGQGLHGATTPMVSLRTVLGCSKFGLIRSSIGPQYGFSKGAGQKTSFLAGTLRPPHHHLTPCEHLPLVVKYGG